MKLNHTNITDESSDGNKKLGVMLVLYTTLVSGFSIFLNSYGVKGLDSSVFTFSKNILVALLLFALIFGAGKMAELKLLKRKHWLQLAAIGLVGGSVPFLLFFKGLQLTTGTESSFIHKTMFIYVAVFALLFLKEKLTKRLLIGAASLLAGTYLMVRPTLDLTQGHLLVLAATLLWAVENVYSKHVLKEVSGNMVAFGRMFFGSLFILIFLAASGKLSLVADLTLPSIAWIIITSALLFLYVLSYYNGLKHIKVSTATCILALGAPITALLSLMTGVSVTVHQATGMLLILLGVVAVVLFPSASDLKERHASRY